MKRIGLVLPNETEARDRALILEQAGYTVDAYGKMNREKMMAIREQPPDAFVIDLSRVPSDGQSFAVWLRQQKNTRRTPVLFAGGAEDKVQRARQILPDVPAVEWKDLLPVLQSALANPLENPLVPGTFDSYSGTPLPKKLGLKPGALVALPGAPDGFEQLLQPLPENTRLVKTIEESAGADIILLFCRSMAELAQQFPGAASALAKGGRLWIVWPKKTSAIQSDLSERSVRAFGLGAGFVDYKISAIDPTWSGLCFARRDQGKKE